MTFWINKPSRCHGAAAAVVLVTGLLLCGPLSKADGLVLNELMAANQYTQADEYGDFDDWLEITNTGSTAINLSGLGLTDDIAVPDKFLFPSITLEPGDYLVVWADDEPEQGDLHAAFKLTSGGESVWLLSGLEVIDTTTFPPLQPDSSWGRWPDGSGGWKILGTATPGWKNEDQEQTPVAVYLNEVMADNMSTFEDPQEAGEYPDWIELYNAENRAIDLGGMFLTDDAADPRKFEIVSGVSIPAGGFVVFIADNEPEQGPFHTNFKLSSSGETVFLFDGSRLVDMTSFGVLGSDVSWGRYPDGTGEWKHLGAATPGWENEDPELPVVRLYINEFMADNATTIENPDASGEYTDWIEIYNAEANPVDLGGLFLTDDTADLTKFPIPAGLTVPAGGYLVFWADDQPGLGPLHTNFKLSKSGEIIILVQTDGMTQINAVPFGEQQTDVSMGRYPDGSDNWSSFSHPTPGSSNLPESSTGLSLYLDTRTLAAGDRFHLHFILWTDTASYVSDVYLLLDVYGVYFTWPDWTPLETGLEFRMYTVDPGHSIHETVFDFPWPAVEGTADGLFFYGAAVRGGTFEIIGDLQIIRFSYI